jgi:spore coat protein JB
MSEARSVKLLEQMQAIDYMLVELNFYLTATPNDTYAINQILALVEQREKIISQLQDQIGAISSYDILSDPDNWKWNIAPSSK